MTIGNVLITSIGQVDLIGSTCFVAGALFMVACRMVSKSIKRAVNGHDKDNVG